LRCAHRQDIYERLDELDPSTFETDAAKLLHGLGFDRKMMAKGTKDMSGACYLLVVVRPHCPKAASLHSQSSS
jgi:ATPase subunit of ABC transporter with duplicated ATPase domains